MNKKIRQDLKQLKYQQRIKRFVLGLDTYITRDGERIHQPKAADVIADKGQLNYMTTSTPCSCWMCAYNKYRRHEQKIENRKMLEEGLEEGE